MILTKLPVYDKDKCHSKKGFSLWKWKICIYIWKKLYKICRSSSVEPINLIQYFSSLVEYLGKMLSTEKALDKCLLNWIEFQGGQRHFDRMVLPFLPCSLPQPISASLLERIFHFPMWFRDCLCLSSPPTRSRSLRRNWVKLAYLGIEGNTSRGVRVRWGREDSG